MADKTGTLLRRERMEMTLCQAIDLFLATKQTEGKSVNTIRWYKDMLTRFSEYLGSPKLQDVTVDQARSFIATLQSKTTKYEEHPFTGTRAGSLSAYTVHGYVRTLKVFSAWLMEEGFAKGDVFARLKRPKLPEPLIETLTDEEIAAIVSGINANSFLGARLYAIVLLLLDTGIRAEELCTLTVEHTNLNQSTVKVMGKGRKERIVPFGSATKKALIRYLNTFRPETDCQNLFVSPQGSALTYSGLSQTLRRLGRRVGVPRIHPHFSLIV